MVTRHCGRCQPHTVYALACLARGDGPLLTGQMMIKHHQGAVAMAKTEQTSGKSTKAVELAKKIETAQTAEIATMQKLLNQLP